MISTREDNNLLTKFDQFAYKQIDGVSVEKDGKRVVDENYYMLEDFTVYDKGQCVEQTGLTMTFPDESSAFGSMKELILRGLEEDALLETKRDADVPKLIDDIAKMKFSVAPLNFEENNGTVSSTDPRILAMSDKELIAEAERIFNTAGSGQTYDPMEEASLPEWWKMN